MNNTIKQQLEMLKTLDFQVDGKPSKEFPESFSDIIFLKTNTTNLVDTSEKTFIFEDYIIKPFEGFDFHKKFNKNIPPPAKIMQGQIIRETEKMYYIKVHTQDTSKMWEGFVPKKSCKVS